MTACRLRSQRSCIRGALVALCLLLLVPILVHAASPQVREIRVEPTLVTDAHVGEGTSQVMVRYDQSMDPSLPPTFDFDPSVAAIGSVRSWQWMTSFSANDTYVATFDVSDTNTNTLHVAVSADLARSASGDVQAPHKTSPMFDVRLSPLAVLVPYREAVLEGESADYEFVFIDTAGNGPHTATIDWGDRTSSQNATIVGHPGAGSVQATHMYRDEGNYNVTITVSDRHGASSSESFLVTATNVPPQFSFEWENGVPDPQRDPSVDAATPLLPTLRIYYSDLGPDDTLDRSKTSIAWGDNSTATALLDGTDESGQQYLSASHTYTAGGIHDVGIVLTDNDGGSRTRATRIRAMTNALPLLEDVPPITVAEGTTHTFTLRFSDPDPNDTHTVLVDFGDGQGAKQATVVESGGTGTATIAHLFRDDGIASITVSVADSKGFEVEKRFKAFVANVPPQFALSFPSAVVDTLPQSGSTVVATRDLRLHAFFTDPGSDDTIDLTQCSVDWGDGSTSTDLRISGSTTQPYVSGMHVYTAPGVYTVALTLTDNDGGTRTESAIVRIALGYPPIKLNAYAPVFQEGDVAEIKIPFVDPDSVDYHTASVRFDDDSMISWTHSISRGGVSYPTLYYTVYRPDGSKSQERLFRPSSGEVILLASSRMR